MLKNALRRMHQHCLLNLDFTPAGYNYGPVVNHQLHFTSLDQQLCLNVTIIDNSVVEERMVQNFTIELRTDNYLVNVSHPAVVEIIDNDCEYSILCSSYIDQHNITCSWLCLAFQLAFLL